jgi:plastocyanin
MKLLRFAPVLALACGGNGGGGTGPCTPGMATQLVKTTGTNPPGWYFNNPLPTPLSVTVKDANNCAVPGIVVSWSITTGGGGLSATQSTTSSSGVATIVDSIGSASTQVVHATSAGLQSQDFQVTAAAPPTTVDVALGNNFFDPADAVVQATGSVTWTWNGTEHTLTFTSGPPPLPTESDQTTGTRVITFNTVGKYAYHCRIHGGMTGSLTVVH